MRLKEKLAIEYCNSLGAPYTEFARGLIAEDFIAGFEKAKDMAAELGHNYKGAGHGPTIEEQLNKLGEDEV